VATIARKIRKMDEEAAASENVVVKALKVCSRNWIYARSIEASDSSLKFDKLETEEAVSKIMKYVEDKEKGSFKPSRERDKLSLGLENPKHIGRTWGLGKRMTWKHRFKEDQHIYKKHGRDQESNLECEGFSCEGAAGARHVYGATDTNGAARRTGISWHPSGSS
jgi:hypothetical protein